MKAMLIVMCFFAGACSSVSEAVLTDADYAVFKRISIQHGQLSLAILQNEDDQTRRRYFCTKSWFVEFKPGWHVDPRIEWTLKVYPSLAADLDRIIIEYGKAKYCPKQLRDPAFAIRRGQDVLDKIGPLAETFNNEYYQRFRTDRRVFRRGIYPAVYELK